MNEEIAQKIIDAVSYQEDVYNKKCKRYEDAATENLTGFIVNGAINYLSARSFTDLFTRSVGSTKNNYTQVEIVERLQRLTAGVIRSYTLYPPSSTGIMDNLQKRCEAQAAAELQEIISSVMEKEQ